jgi:hypothetical protein
MSCKISKKFTLKQGKEEYLMLTADFGSLQMRLTTQDTSINPSTFGKCDPGLYDIYRSDTECPDAHSNTGKIVFVDSVGGKVIDIETDEGTQHLYQNFGVKVKRNNKEVWIEAQDLEVGDDIVEIMNDPLVKVN